MKISLILNHECTLQNGRDGVKLVGVVDKSGHGHKFFSRMLCAHTVKHPPYGNSWIRHWTTVMPESSDLAIFVPMQTKPITLPRAHVRGVMTVTVLVIFSHLLSSLGWRLSTTNTWPSIVCAPFYWFSLKYMQ